MILCKNCGHRASYHDGIDKYEQPRLSCKFETDRGEVCTCKKLKITDEDLTKVVEIDKQRLI